MHWFHRSSPLALLSLTLALLSLGAASLSATGSLTTRSQVGLSTLLSLGTPALEVLLGDPLLLVRSHIRVRFGVLVSDDDGLDLLGTALALGSGRLEVRVVSSHTGQSGETGQEKVQEDAIS